MPVPLFNGEGDQQGYLSPHLRHQSREKLRIDVEERIRDFSHVQGYMSPSFALAIPGRAAAPRRGVARGRGARGAGLSRDGMNCIPDNKHLGQENNQEGENKGAGGRPKCSKPNKK